MKWLDNTLRANLEQYPFASAAVACLIRFAVGTYRFWLDGLHAMEPNGGNMRFPDLKAKPTLMTQQAPYPTALASVVGRVNYRPGWQIWLSEMQERDKDADGNIVGKGLTLIVKTLGYNSYKPSDVETYRVNHYFIVPAATYDERAWTRWLFDQLVLVETHEAMEFFRVGKRRPFAPNHGAGRNPYSILERGTEEDATTLFDGRKTKGTT